METAIKLFAAKGFDATSIQEIASHAGISKGAFYLHFKSKEALLLEIFKYYYEKNKEKMESLKGLNLAPEDLFIEHIVCQYESILNKKDFIIMHAREQALPFNDSVAETIKSMRRESAEMIRQNIYSLYGQPIEEYQWDLTILVQGMIHSYLELILFLNMELDLYEIAGFILNRTHDIAQGLLQSDANPIITSHKLTEFMNCPFPGKVDRDSVLQAISSAKEDYKDSEDALVSLELIESEMLSKNPRIPVIRGMLSNLESEEGMQSLVRKIEFLFNI